MEYNFFEDNSIGKTIIPTLKISILFAGLFSGNWSHLLAMQKRYSNGTYPLIQNAI